MPYKDPNDPRRKITRRAWKARNKAKVAAGNRVYLRRHYERHRETILRDKVPEYSRRRRANQEVVAGRPRPEVCEVCGRSPGKHRLHFDHSHQRGHFRGWLCNKCNRTLGYCDDDPQILLKLAAYLQRTAANSSPQLSLPGM